MKRSYTKDVVMFFSFVLSLTAFVTTIAVHFHVD